MQNTYDLIVIGSGPGGFKGAIQAAKLGKKVLIVEKGKWGGFCAHTGTIPSKSLREAAIQQKKPNFAKAMNEMRRVVREEAKIILQQLDRNHVDRISGAARFLCNESIEVVQEKKRAEFSAKFFLIATGTSPIQHKDFPSTLDSDRLLRLKVLPKKLLIIGAGVIGCEYASIFSKLGSNVTLVDRRKELLRNVDLEIVEALRKEFRSSKIELHLGAEVHHLKKIHSKQKEIVINKKKRIFDAVVICMGRSANSKDLGLETLPLDDRGNIKVDENYCTSLSSIYAVGDVIGPPSLAAASAEQGRIAASRMFQIPCSAFPSSFPYGIYTIPEISSVGLQEDDLKKQQIPYVVGRSKFSELARGLIVNDRIGFIKLLVHQQSRKILGVHGIGSGMSELIHIGQSVLSLGAPVDFLVDNVFNYPTFAEAYKIAALHAINQIRKNHSS